MKSILLDTIKSLKNRPYGKTARAFIRQVNSNKYYTQETNPSHHFCSFFLPIDLKTKSIFLGHHIKADDWIPPGGHLDEDETPLETVKREFTEELHYNLTKELIKLVDLSIKKINNPKIPCRVHFDFWYIVLINRINFVYDKDEFYNAHWFYFPETSRLTKEQDYNLIIQGIINNTETL